MSGAYLETAAAGAPYLFFGVVLGFLLACFAFAVAARLGKGGAA